MNTINIINALSSILLGALAGASSVTLLKKGETKESFLGLFASVMLTVFGILGLIQ